MGFCEDDGARAFSQREFLDKLRRAIRDLIYKLIESAPDEIWFAPRNAKGETLPKKDKILINRNGHRAGALYYYILPVVEELLRVGTNAAKLTPIHREAFRSKVEDAMLLAKIHFPAARQGLRTSSTKALMEQLVDFVGARRTYFSLKKKNNEAHSILAKLIVLNKITDDGLLYLIGMHFKTRPKAKRVHQAKDRAQQDSPFFESLRKTGQDFDILEPLRISRVDLNGWETAKVASIILEGNDFFCPDVAKFANPYNPAVLLGAVLFRIDFLKQPATATGESLSKWFRRSDRSDNFYETKLLGEIRDILSSITTQDDITKRIEYLKKKAGQDGLNPVEKGKLLIEVNCLENIKTSAAKAAISVERRVVKVAEGCAYYYTHSMEHVSMAKLEKKRELSKDTLSLVRRLIQLTTKEKLSQSLCQSAITLIVALRPRSQASGTKGARAK